MRFQKGNSGKPKGRKNKFTSLKQSFLNVYQRLGGDAAFFEWVKADRTNRGNFYQMITKILPKEVNVGGQGDPVRIIVVKTEKQPESDGQNH